MERSSLDQATDLLLRSTRGILLAVPPDPPRDVFASAQALALALGELGKLPTLVCPTHVPPTLAFLPGTSQIRDSLGSSPEVRLSVPLGDSSLDHLAWEIAEDRTLHITLHPAAGQVLPVGPVTAERSGYPWDCVVCVGAPRLAALGDLFTTHAPFFFDTPILNLDRGTVNEFYGTVNFVPATATTLAEVAVDLLEALGGEHLLTREVATALLAGLLAGTDSFRAPATTPRAFATASRLLTEEADHLAVVRHLFQSHTLPHLRLLGRVLARVLELPSAVNPAPLLSHLTAEDFQTVGSTPDAVLDILPEVRAWVGDRLIVLAFERNAGGPVEALVAPGRASPEDHHSFARATRGTTVGSFTLVNLGTADRASVADTVTTHLLPRLPRAHAA